MSPQVRHFVPYFACGTLGLLLFFTILPLARRDDSATAKIDPQNYSLSLSTPQSTNLSINPSSSGAVGIAENSISVTANSPSGYTLYIATNKGVTDNKIYLEGATTKDNTNTINATTGTFASPAALDNNSWGYAVANVANFDATYDTTSPSADAKFAAMPLYANVDHDTTQAIKHKTASAITPETTTVYLGTKANMTLTPGDYTTTLSYLVIGHLVDSASTIGEIDIAEGETTIPGDYSNKTIHLTTSLSTNLYLGDVAVNLTNGDTTSSCADIVITTQNPLTLSCKLPNSLALGSYDVAVETGIWTHTKENLFTIKNFFYLEYNKNTTDTVTSLPEGVEDSSDDPDDASLSFNVTGKPVRSGYNFLGYDENSTATTPTYAFDPDNNSYTPATISVPKNTTKTLYAIWEVASLCGTTPAMQNITNLKSTLFKDVNTQVQLCDERDGKTYYAAKQADGNIWMTQNLDFVLDTGTTLTAADTDLNSATAVANGWTPNRSTQDHQYKTASGIEDPDGQWDGDFNTTAHSYRPASDVAAGTSGDYGNDGDTYFSPVYMQNGTTFVNWKTEDDCIGAGNSAETCAHWSVGTFYSWFAATAGSGNASVTSSGTNVSDSICPKGWRLPTGGSSGEFSKLGLTKSNISISPFYFLRSGLYLGLYGAVYGTGRYGRYWSSTSTNSSCAYYLYFNSSSVNPSNDLNRYRGMSVRCVAR